MSGLGLREQIARIDSLLAGTQRRRRKSRIQHWQMGVALTGGAAAFFLAGAAFARLMGS